MNNLFKRLNKLKKPVRIYRAGKLLERICATLDTLSEFEFKKLRKDGILMDAYQIPVIDNIISYDCYVSDENTVGTECISSDIYTPHMFMINVYENNSVLPNILPGMRISINPNIKDGDGLFAVEWDGKAIFTYVNNRHGFSLNTNKNKGISFSETRDRFVIGKAIAVHRSL